MASMKGTIKRLVSDKGFGFIAAGDGNDTSSTSRRAREWRSTTCAKDRRSRSRAARVRRVRGRRTSGSRRRRPAPPFRQSVYFDHLTPRQVSGTFGASHAPLRTAPQLLRAVPAFVCTGNHSVAPPNGGLYMRRVSFFVAACWPLERPRRPGRRVWWSARTPSSSPALPLARPWGRCSVEKRGSAPIRSTSISRAARC